MPLRQPLFPVALEIGGRECLVVGAGPVAARKAAGLLDCGANVTVVAPGIGSSMTELADRSGDAGGSLRIERRDYHPGEAADYRLVITATGIRDVDGAVYADADAAGVWVNSADDVDRCTFILPAIHRDGMVTVSISTGGASPALASWLRRQMGDALGGGLGAMAALLEQARRRVKAEGRSTEGLAWPALLDGPFPELVREGRLDEASALVDQLVAPPDLPTSAGRP